ncbi:MAG: hypothetical protein GWN99_06285 [Gemmatimonadetes bacterium]|uniref:Lipoprotein n=1 Tax=Candidatus Kutchimonas denitrificans TaxID=3056748 RepID=A0AAE5CBR9_9BACT|nr:hypothetical protein [Gemmatimonadota bacterium]NIR76232.1 hypothetical protein [Candidatus Kutchimonas denitrificans]NIS00672.1 hypothetical protein [Gemmatimonadota bacterium]NIT66817.1 hypothetical protein [Gemmatimonadota bacterium]NIV23416.1 hypothetical protein [Gemmatimonadota bacterium]
MSIRRLLRLAAVALPSLAALTACGDSGDPSFPLPEEPLQTTLYDLVDGPIDRPSALNIVSGRGNGIPTTPRVDVSGQWDVVFAVIDGQPSLVPRGFFDGLEVSSGVRALQPSFDDVTVVTGEAENYEAVDPTPVAVGQTYAIRSRPDPSLSLPCRVYAKLEVLDLEGDPVRLQFRILWNPNCDETTFSG